MPPHPDARCAAIAATQHGCITLSQAREAGLTPRAVAHRRDTGRWRRVHRGVDVIAGVPATPHQALCAAVLAGGPTAVASHASARWLHGLGPKPATWQITVGGSGRRVSDVTVHRTRCLSEADRDRVAGIRCTSVVRTLVDVVGGLDELERLELLDEVVVGGVAAHDIEAAAQALARGRPGASWLAVQAGSGAVGRFRSRLEREGAAAFAAHGLPAPLWNVEVRDVRGRPWRVDALWWPWPVVAELDGLRWHRDAGAFQRDRDMDRGLRRRGVTVMRFTWRDVLGRPRRVATEVAAVLGAAMTAGLRVDDAALAPSRHVQRALLDTGGTQ